MKSRTKVTNTFKSVETSNGSTLTEVDHFIAHLRVERRLLRYHLGQPFRRAEDLRDRVEPTGSGLRHGRPLLLRCGRRSQSCAALGCFGRPVRRCGGRGRSRLLIVLARRQNGATVHLPPRPPRRLKVHAGVRRPVRVLGRRRRRRGCRLRIRITVEQIARQFALAFIRVAGRQGLAISLRSSSRPRSRAFLLVLRAGSPSGVFDVDLFLAARVGGPLHHPPRVSSGSLLAIAPPAAVPRPVAVLGARLRARRGARLLSRSPARRDRRVPPRRRGDRRVPLTGSRPTRTRVARSGRRPAVVAHPLRSGRQESCDARRGRRVGEDVGRSPLHFLVKVADLVLGAGFAVRPAGGQLAGSQRLDDYPPTKTGQGLRGSGLGRDDHFVWLFLGRRGGQIVRNRPRWRRSSRAVDVIAARRRRGNSRNGGGGRRRRPWPVSLPLLLLRQLGNHLIDVGARRLSGRRGRRWHLRRCLSRRRCHFGTAEDLRFAVSVDHDRRHELVVFEVLPAGHQSLKHWRVRVALAVDQKRRRHQMRRQLRLLVEHVVVSVSDQRPVVRVEKYCFGQLLVVVVRHCIVQRD